MKLTTHVYPVLRFRMGGSMPLLTTYAFMARRGTTLLLTNVLDGSRRMRWAEHVAHMEKEKRYTDRFWFGKHEGKRLHGRPRLS
jgi:hypothetical protein